MSTQVHRQERPLQCAQVYKLPHMMEMRPIRGGNMAPREGPLAI